MSIRTMTGAILAATLAAPIAANAHAMRFPNPHDGLSVPMMNRMDPMIGMEADVEAMCLDGTMPIHICIERGYGH